MKLYDKNLEAINHNSDLQKWVKSAKPVDWIEFIEDENFLIKKQNKVLKAYEEDYINSVSAISNQNIFFKDTATILIGVGSGKLLHSILKGMVKGHRVILVEIVPVLVEKAFENYDFSKWLFSTELLIASTKEDIAKAVTLLDGTLVIQDWITLSEPYVMWAEEYSELLTYTADILDQHRCGVGTVIGAGPTIAENDIKNLPFILKDRGIKDLKDIYSGKIAVSVATGPSLVKNIHLLKEIQDQVIIVAVAQSLRILLAYDIKPDFITTVDYGEVNFEHFEGLLNSDVPLIALNRAYYKILKHWSGPKFITGTPVPGYDESVQKIIENKGCLEQGGSVVHLSYQFAKHLGCNRIALLGHNLSYENDLSHVPLVDAGGEVEIGENGIINWKISDPRSSLKNQKLSHGMVLQIPGYFGEPVKTNIGLSSFITTFEGMFKSDEGTVKIYNCTEGGANIKGAENRTLESFIKKEVRQEDPIYKSVIKDFFSPDPEFEANLKKSIEYLEKDLVDLKEISELAGKGIEAAEKMLIAGKRRRDYNKWTQRNEDYSKRAQALCVKSPLMGLHIYAASRRIYGRDLKVRGDHKHLLRNMDDRKIRVDRNKLILGAAKSSSEKLHEIYLDTLSILKQYEKTRNELLLTERIPDSCNLTDWNAYIEKDNWAHPLIEAKKALNSGFDSIHAREIITVCEQKRDESISKQKFESIRDERQKLLEYNSLVEQARKSGKSKNLDEALKLLTEAREIFPDKFEARQGLATTNAMLGNTEVARDMYSDLIKDFPGNHRAIFEYGIVLLNTSIEDGTAHIKDAMTKSSDYNHFLSVLGDLSLKLGLQNEAIEYYTDYLKHFPGDYAVKDKLKTLEAPDDGITETGIPNQEIIQETVGVEN